MYSFSFSPSTVFFSIYTCRRAKMLQGNILPLCFFFCSSSSSIFSVFQIHIYSFSALLIQHCCIYLSLAFVVWSINEEILLFCLFTGLTMAKAQMSLTPPKDKFKLVFLIFLLHGLGTLMPWNMFITAKSVSEAKNLIELNITRA